MHRYSRKQVSDAALEKQLGVRVAQDRATTADLLADLGEYQDRQLYLPSGYPSMFVYCMRRLHMSEDMTSRRLRAARAAREFPAIFTAVADGRLHLTAVVLLAPYLDKAPPQELIAAATHKSRSEVERMLAERFPQADMAPRVRALPHTAVVPEASPAPARVNVPVREHANQPGSPAPARVDAPASPGRVIPLAPKRFGVQFTMGESAHDDLMAVQDLLRHQVPNGDLAAVFERALKLLRQQLEKRKFAATDTPRRKKMPAKPGSRHVPAHVRRAVWVRDGGRCTFVGKDGKRCEARGWLELDHRNEFARGGSATIEGMRLLCRAHNQYSAEQTYGTEFMKEKRQVAAHAPPG